VSAGTEGTTAVAARICQYQGLSHLVEKSGLGVAAAHQREMYRQLGAVLTARPWRADLIHLNSVFPDAVALALLGRALGIPVVMHAHSTEQDFRDSFRGSNRLAPLFGRWLRFVYSRGDLVLTPTDYSRDLIESLLAGGGRARCARGATRPLPPVRTISNGVDTRFFSPDSDAATRFRARHGLEPDTPVVVSVGHLFVRKGVLDLVEVARLLPQVRFIWFGHTDRRFLTADVARAVDSAPPNLLFAGFVDAAQLRDAYCGADAFCFLSHEETEGIVVLEALACGTRAVLRDIPIYRQWLGRSGAATLVADGRGLPARAASAVSAVLAIAGRIPAGARRGMGEGVCADRALASPAGLREGAPADLPTVRDTREEGLRAARAVDLRATARRLAAILREAGMWPGEEESRA
jgi:1,2-diacylglycerol-3-alpha-glucose alpha-1,2-glucosyltransferase